MGYPDDCGCCSPVGGMNLVEMCGLAACWEELVPTEDLSGTRTEAVGLTGESERRNHDINRPYIDGQSLSLISECLAQTLKFTQ